MKKKLLSLLCVVVMLVTFIPGALAAERSSMRIGKLASASKGNLNAEWENYLVENNANLTIYLMGSCGYLDNDDNGNSIWNLYFDTTNKLSAKSNQSWVAIKRVGNNLVFNYDSNSSTANRSAKVTVTAKNFKATLTFIQFGKDTITSAKRNKNKVTIKLQKGKASKHYLSISESKSEEDPEWGTIRTSRTVYSGAYNKASYTFKVRKGYHYYIDYGPAVKTSWGGYNYTSTSGVSFDIEKVSGTEVYSPW